MAYAIYIQVYAYLNSAKFSPGNLVFGPILIHVYTPGAQYIHAPVQYIHVYTWLRLVREFKYANLIY